MDRTELMIHQHLYWPDIRDSVQTEVTNYDTFQRKKLPNEKQCKLPAKLAKEIPQNKFCVDIIGPYVIQRNNNKEKLHLQAVTIIDPVTGWFEIAQYEYK